MTLLPPKCACKNYCGDVAEQDDSPFSVCKGMDPAPAVLPRKFCICHPNAVISCVECAARGYTEPAR